MKDSIKIDNRYQLRYAAGMYFLLDMEQSRDTYKRPLQMNSTGALIIEKLLEGLSKEEVVDCLYEEYREEAVNDSEPSDLPDRESLMEDVCYFINQLRSFSVDI